MDSSRLLLLIVMVITPSDCSDTDKPRCKEYEVESFNLPEGEAFYFVPKPLPDFSEGLSSDQFTWCKNNSGLERISTDKNQSVHSQNYALFFLNLSSEDSGLYTLRFKDRLGCYNFYLKVEVFKEKTDTALLYGEIKNSDVNKMVSCPEAMGYTCDMFEGSFSWMKDFEFLQGENDEDLWVYNTTKKDEGIYTCTCSWTYNNKEYKSSGSKRLRVIEQTVHRTPKFISPAGNKLFADEGFEIKMKCSVMCGTNVKPHCHASWRVNGVPFIQTNGYNQTTEIVTEDPSANTISTAVLTIEKVSAKDFQTHFECIGEGFYKTLSKTVTLERRDSIIPLVIGGVLLSLVCVFGALLVKCFAIDLVLLFRPYFPLRNQNKDKKVYDAYVVYQMQRMATDDTLCQFVTNTLPSVLEEKCGYRLFVYGRDDLPGEDCLQVVEDRIKQSRRLMAILTPGSGSGSEITDQLLASPQNSAIGGFDWQVGLHHVLVLRDMSVILIQLGNTGPEGYSHLPPGLQHLIRSSAPIRWPEGTRAAAAKNSSFWKRVRYLMPATPAKKCAGTAII